MTASSQATVDAHAVGADRRAKSELSIETRPDARQEAERARQDAQEAHDRRHPDNTHEEPLRPRRKMPKNSAIDIVDGRQHGRPGA